MKTPQAALENLETLLADLHRLERHPTPNWKDCPEQVCWRAKAALQELQDALDNDIAF